VNLDELATAMKKTSGDPVALKLSDLVSAWKDDESNAKGEIGSDTILKRYRVHLSPPAASVDFHDV
jgi:hypothetical protein